MSRKLPSLNAVRAFEVAARHLNLTRAAEELCVTHGAVSRQVKALEERLGVPLFRREGGRTELTSEGEALAATAGSAFDLLAATTARIERPRNRGTLIASISSTFMMRWLIPRLHRFRERHPGVEVHLLASFEPVDFDRERVDVAVRLTHPPEDEGTTVIPFLDEAFGPVCSPRVLATAPFSDAAGLRQHRIMVADTRPDVWGEWSAAASVALPKLRRPQRFPHVHFMLEAAVAGLGVAIASRALVEDDLKGGRLVAPLGFVPSGVSYHLIYPAYRKRDPDIVAFRDWFLDEAKRPGGPRPERYRVGVGVSPE